MLRQLFMVGIGGAAGSIVRFLTSLMAARYAIGFFPLGTFIANLAGCFLIGLFAGMFPVQQQLRLLLITGFCGGYTTFSTFSAETLTLIHDKQILFAVINILASVAGGLLAVWLGMSMTKS